MGAEEQAPSCYNAKTLGKLLGMPAFPITTTNPWIPVLGLIPYPSRYHIHFGAVVERLWRYEILAFPPPEVDHLQYDCVVDLTRMREVLKFTPKYDWAKILREMRSYLQPR